ncbi:MAG: 16S rRNA (guanine(966)-N(2))-methyltransferase RsmD [Alphaproteobacteria bacterium]
MRIISGKHKGRRIEVSKEMGDIRPTSDFAREAIFNILSHSKVGLNGHTFTDKQVLDVFCGTGAFGLEALSRGAAKVTFVDKSREAIAIARHNAERMHEEGNAEFILTDASKLSRARRAYDLIFLDPPYFSKLIPTTLASLRDGGWIAEDAVIVAEHDAKETIELPEGFEKLDERRYGRAVVELIRLTA